VSKDSQKIVAEGVGSFCFALTLFFSILLPFTFYLFPFASSLFIHFRTFVDFYPHARACLAARSAA
jgi:hypothetical protein